MLKNNNSNFKSLNMRFENYVCESFIPQFSPDELKKIIILLENHTVSSDNDKAFGRTSIFEVETGNQNIIIKKYSRGGIAAKFLNQKYLSESRFKNEFLLLKFLEENNIETVKPAFIIYKKIFLFFRLGWLATYKLQNYINFYEILINSKFSAERILQLFDKIILKISELNKIGVYHPDVQIKNIMITADLSNAVIIDFDKSRIVKPNSLFYFHAMFYRFLRSTAKLNKKTEFLKKEDLLKIENTFFKISNLENQTFFYRIVRLFFFRNII
ncbi:MAG TPA: lipopolysaccharide kinase InaA family protein [bacterium]|nr:lipopolysaccharide kinase InaA family protein [bacterium]